MNRIFTLASLALGLGLAASGCKSMDEQLPNPNVPTVSSAVPPSLLLPRIEFDLYNSGDGGPFSQVQRWNQYTISNNLYYGGQNQYNWTTTASLYGVLKNANQMDVLAAKQLGTRTSAYAALAKFYRAYVFVWQAQRVGDTPAAQAGQGLDNLTPAYDTQKAVYARSLALLDSANTMLAGLAGSSALPAAISGDIYYNNDLSKWRKLINSYKLRVLISLSRRAADNPDLQIPQQFAAIVNNPAQYPVLTSNADNWSFVFNSAYNTYPHTPNDGNNQYQNAGAAYLSLTTATQDPRTFITATPAPAQLAAGKAANDFSAYVGSSPATGLSDLMTGSNAGQYSFTNYLRYYSSVAGPEPYIILGYPELNFNIAEGINRGWVPGASAAAYYLKGINASLDFYGLAEGQVLTIGNVSGKPVGTATVSRSAFLANPNVAYKGDNANGLEQILNQKYVAFFQNSGYEAFYNWRRTGLPRTFVSTGGGINASGKIPRRWQYPVDEQTYNADNYRSALQSQFGGTDDLNQDTWLTK
ncbi:SusD/RagB family nutrient-binding outer membrane lipoprotein [Hymenobacter cheonanensis]|uniref:SusD/RagB family nutrient-binding outer membrane lipoprotein n=1 Tax=Hymenobacter sp. CA2-7 TaxID=3063993 RepID=UPI0027124993|nr:SusD/RagB family nutrient-binding outer membrane lipoprotein [Hymenobacter sp. CA2-7]MDO7884565.1 SusD/RagB family nutrient-binding outer membrane lipoprotein [Hymenobacter sp. CA2-7]